MNVVFLGIVFVAFVTAAWQEIHWVGGEPFLFCGVCIRVSLQRDVVVFGDAADLDHLFHGQPKPPRLPWPRPSL
jgi:hypothetical protein